MNAQSKGYRTGEEIYDNISCDGFFNMNAMRIQTTFPPIGTFTLDSTLGPPPGQSQNQQSISQHPPPIGIFDANEVPEVIQNPATIGVFQSNSVLNNGGSGGGGNNSSSIFSSQSSSSSAANDPSQATRETGIIEKLLVCYILYLDTTEQCMFVHISATSKT
ncbi:uncharacterized protein LOC118746218 [Rhagoletis pomonella]|uniref:uncharacterized protein LOC118746218 n=1 Tax=Rhagoletis pomonella TaxID=28610 RepID=UPI00177CBBDA|nr:uncharacterized protein LOC118746218 [Rhagoletis pomonella]